MAQLFVNFVRSQLEQTLLAGGTTLFIDTADAALLPAFSPGDTLRGTLSDGIQPPEIIEVTAVSGGTLTVTRGLESTAAQEWPGGTRLTFGTTAALLSSALNAAQAKFRWTGVATGTNAYTLTVVGSVPTPTDGDEVTFFIPNTNTTVVTLTVTNGVTPIGPFSVRNIDGAEFGAGSFAAGFYASLRWVASVGRWVASSLTSAHLPAISINDGPLTDANVLANGDFEQWNLGTSFNTPASGSNTADGWAPAYDGTIGTFTASRQSFTLGHTDTESDPIFFYRWDQTVAGSGSTFRLLVNRVAARNGVAWRNGEIVTFSGYLKADAARTVNLRVEQLFGTGGAPSATVVAVNTPVSVTTSWQRFSTTFTLPSIAGKTLGSNDDHRINAFFSLPLNTTMTIDFAMVQLEPGPRISKPWSPYPVPVQLGGTGRVATSNADLASQQGPAVLVDLLTRDGAGSGLDADLLDALNSTDFVRSTGSVTQTVTGEKNFTGHVKLLGDGVIATAPRISGGQPTMIWYETGAGVNNKAWRWYIVGSVMRLDLLGDDPTFGFVDSCIDITRSTGSISIALAMPLYGDPDGLAATPSICPDSADPNTGFFGVGADTLGITTGGTSRWEISTTLITYTLPLQGPAGSAGTPAFSFSGDPNTGIYNSGADIIAFSCGGAGQAFLGTSAFTITPQIREGDGSAGTPAYSFTNDTSSGLYRIGANNIGISGGGVKIAEWDAVGLVLSDIGPTNTLAAGWRGAPVNTQNTAYGIVLTDAGKTILHDETSARTWTIPANASVAFPIGTVIVLDNTGNAGGAPGALTIAITSDTLRRGDGVAGTGSRTVPSNGVAIIRKTKATEWSITGIFT